MKRIIAFILCTIMVFSTVSCAQSDKDTDVSADGAHQTAQKWIEARIQGNDLFSFEYNGEEFSTFIGSWEKTVSEDTDESGNQTYTVTYKSSDGLSVKADILLYNDFPAVDWVCSFENAADSDSGVISNIQAMDSFVEGENMVLTYANGSNANEYDFTPINYDFTENASLTITSEGGRSSSGYMPYFDLTGDNGGVIAAIGWTGQWACTIAKNEDSASITAGMEKTRISLYAGEGMRTPSMVLLFFDGDSASGHNLFRQMILGYYSPKDENGQTVTELPLFTNAWGSAGEDSILSKINSYDVTKVAYDGLWMDAGWHGKQASTDTYDSTWAYQVGNWYVNKDIYPNTLSVIGDALAERGKEFLLWFEPERVVKGTDLYNDYPEYMMPMSTAATWTLFDLSNDEATDYLINLISGLIQENGITWYRQDFNCDPLGKWVYKDGSEGENRVGMTEIKYITNLYRYLDALLAQNPGLMIDNCASGGKRLDIEMMKRSVPLWRTDYTVNGSDSTADGVRNINMNLSYWLPLHCGGNGTDGMDDDYEFRSMMSSGLTVGTISANYGWFEEMFDQYYRCRKLMTSNYYILAQGSGEDYDNENAAYMYYSEAKGEGYVMLFHPKGSTVSEQSFQLKGLDAAATYLLEVADTGQTLTATGASLMENGIDAQFAELRSAKLIFITRQ